MTPSPFLGFQPVGNTIFQMLRPHIAVGKIRVVPGHLKGAVPEFFLEAERVTAVSQVHHRTRMP